MKMKNILMANRGDGCPHSPSRSGVGHKKHGRVHPRRIRSGPAFFPGLGDRLIGAALRMAAEARFKSPGTFEHLADVEEPFAFMEANPGPVFVDEARPAGLGE